MRPDSLVKSASGAPLSIGQAIYTRNPSMQKAGYAPVLSGKYLFPT